MKRVVSEFAQDFIHRSKDISLILEFIAKKLHDFTIGQLSVLCFYLALFAEHERILAVRVAMHVEALKQYYRN